MDDRIEQLLAKKPNNPILSQVFHNILDEPPPKAAKAWLLEPLFPNRKE